EELEEEKLEQLARQAIQSVGRSQIRDKFLAFEEEWQNGKKGNVFSLKKWQNWWPVAAAIIFVCLLGGWWLNRAAPNSPEALFAIYYSPYPASAAIRGGGASSNWSDAMLAYQTGNYKEAAQLIEANLVDSVGLIYLKQFYLGNALLSMDPPQPMLAIEAFDQVLVVDSDYGGVAKWYRSLALLLNGQTEEATVALDEIVEKGNYRVSEARELLSRVRRQ
ncbi:MAG: hypothetical protein AAFU67_08225, partial [Bacteroidota bacterium]